MAKRIFTLKDRNTVPPRGFRISLEKGSRSFGFFRDLVRSLGKSEDEVDLLVAEQLAGRGFHHLLREHIPSTNLQGSGEVFPIMPFLLPHVEGYYEDNYFFNPSIVEHGGKVIMAVRRNRAHADIVLCELDEDYQPIPETAVELDLPKAEGAPGNSWEDPRLYSIKGKLMMSYGHWGHVWRHPYLPTQHFCEIDPETYEVTHDYIPIIGKNGQDTEKNWNLFEDDKGNVQCVYSTSPHVVYQVDSGKSTSFNWKYEGWKQGLRGGTPPIKGPDDGLLYSFMRSHENTGKRGRWSYANRRYTVGCYAFEPVAPFRVVKYTPEPLLIASEDDEFLPSAPSVVFSAGNIWKDNQFVVALGIHDMWSAIWKVDMDNLHKSMKEV